MFAELQKDGRDRVHHSESKFVFKNDRRMPVNLSKKCAPVLPGRPTEAIESPGECFKRVGTAPCFRNEKKAGSA
jgi:hypothetical protein